MGGVPSALVLGPPGTFRALLSTEGRSLVTHPTPRPWTSLFYTLWCLTGISDGHALPAALGHSLPEIRREPPPALASLSEGESGFSTQGCALLFRTGSDTLTSALSSTGEVSGRAVPRGDGTVLTIVSTS